MTTGKHQIATGDVEVIAVVHHLSQSLGHLLEEVKSDRKDRSQAKIDAALLRSDVAALDKKVTELAASIVHSALVPTPNSDRQPRQDARVIGAAAAGGGGLIVAISELLQRLF